MVESFVERRKDIILGLRKVRCVALDIEKKAARANRLMSKAVFGLGGRLRMKRAKGLKSEDV